MEFLSALTIGVTRFSLMVAAVALAVLFVKELRETKPAPPVEQYRPCPFCPTHKVPDIGHLPGR